MAKWLFCVGTKTASSSPTQSLPWFLRLSGDVSFLLPFLLFYFSFYWEILSHFYPLPFQGMSPALVLYGNSLFFILLSQLVLKLWRNVRQMMFMYSSFITNLILKRIWTRLTVWVRYNRTTEGGYQHARASAHTHTHTRNILLGLKKTTVLDKCHLRFVTLIEHKI